MYIVVKIYRRFGGRCDIFRGEEGAIDGGPSKTSVKFYYTKQSFISECVNLCISCFPVH